MNYYEDNAREYFEKTIDADMSEACDRFLGCIGEGGRILDLGCGSGRDIIYFENKGYSAEGLEACEKLRDIAVFETGCVIHNGDIRDFVPDKPFDGVWACASLLHLRREEILDFFSRAGDFVAPCGYIYASGKNGIETGMADDGRYFCEFSEELLEDILKVNPGLKVVDKWYSDDVSGRDDFRWMNFVLKYM